MNIHPMLSPMFGKATLKVDTPTPEAPLCFRTIDPNALKDQSMEVMYNRVAQVLSARREIQSPLVQRWAETLPDGITLTYKNARDNSPPVITVTKDGRSLPPILHQDFWFLPNGIKVWEKAISTIAARLNGEQPKKAELKVEISDQASERSKARLQIAKAAIRSNKVQELMKDLPDGMELILRPTHEKQLELVTLQHGEPFMLPVSQQTLGVNFDFQFDYLVWFNAVTIVKKQMELAFFGLNT